MQKLLLLKNKKGFSLLEMIIYIAMLSFLVSIVILLLSGIINSEKRIVSSKNVQISAITALDRITREIRQANSVDMAGSTLGATSGVLKLNSTDSIGNIKSILFSLNGGVIYINENGVSQGPITLQKRVNVTSLIFKRIVTPNSEAVVVTMTIESGTGTAYKSETFYSTVILRGSY